MNDINGVLMQYFHWYSPADGTLWDTVAMKSRELAEAGITALWLPPAYKGIGGEAEVGYGVYDLYDLGEFDQKGSYALNTEHDSSTLMPLLSSKPPACRCMPTGC